MSSTDNETQGGHRLPGASDTSSQRSEHEGTPRVRVTHHHPREDGSVPAPEAHAVDCQMGQCRGVTQADLMRVPGPWLWYLSAPCGRLVEHARRLRERSERRENGDERSESPLSTPVDGVRHASPRRKGPWLPRSALNRGTYARLPRPV